MVRSKKPSFKETDILRASEIGQYHFCSIAWYLQKCGYQPISPMLEIGTKKHIELGKIMDYAQKKTNKSTRTAIIGYFMLLFGVIL